LTVAVRKKIATIDINMQELEGLEPSQIQSFFYNDGGSLTSANDYVAMLLQSADNAFARVETAYLIGIRAIKVHMFGPW
jgi:hypothetical protein